MPGGDGYNPTIRWVHISDLHMASDNVTRFNIGGILPHIIADIQDFNPHFVTFSGDISYTGKKSDFDVVEEQFCRKLVAKNLTNNMIFLCPGNHDVNWENLVNLSSNLTANICSQDDMTRLLTSQENLLILSASQLAYIQFTKRFGCGAPNPEIFGCGAADSEIPSVNVHQFSIKDKRIVVAALSTVFLAKPEPHKPKEREPDYGCLAIGEYQIRKAAEIISANTPHLSILITHHPLYYLRDWDRDGLEPYLSRSFDFHLFGHLHAPSFKYTSSLLGKLTSVQTGALFSDHHSECIYTRFTWFLNTDRVSIVARRLNKRTSQWLPEGEALEVNVGNPKTETRKVESIPLRLLDYQIVRSKSILKDLQYLSLDYYHLYEMMMKVFYSHVNFFRRDYEKLPIPLERDYYLLLSKLGRTIELHRIVSCRGIDLGTVSAWNQIVLDYRKATYFAYREPDRVNQLTPNDLRTPIELHRTIRKEIADFFKKFLRLELDYQAAKGSMGDNLLSFHLNSSLLQCTYADQYLKERRLYVPGEAESQAIIALETSLMHIHKIIVSYFPGDTVDVREGGTEGTS